MPVTRTSCSAGFGDRATGYNRPVSRLISVSTAPVWLPLLAFAQDFLALHYIFFHEPGITQRDEKVSYIFRLPSGVLERSRRFLRRKRSMPVVPGWRWYEMRRACR